MFGGDYTGFLLSIAEEVDRWIAEPCIMQSFREHLRDFCQLDGTTRYFLLSLPYESYVEEAANYLYGDQNETFSEGDKLSADYAKLTIIHDKRLKGPAIRKINNGIWPEDENQDCRPEDVWNHIKEQIHTREAQADIRCVLKRVKVNMDKETEHKASRRRRLWTGIISFIKEAYRITIRSFFD